MSPELLSGKLSGTGGQIARWARRRFLLGGDNRPMWAPGAGGLPARGRWRGERVVSRGEIAACLVLWAASSDMSARSAVAATPYTVEVDFDRPGADHDRFEQEGSWQGPELCRDACESDRRCRSFTYVRPGVEGPRGRCRLKDRVPPPVENRCCISGVKGGRPPQRAEASTGLQLAWRGWTADWSRHHFRLTVTLPAPQELVSVALSTSEEPDKLVELEHVARQTRREPDFTTQEADSLQVEGGGRRIEPGPTGSLGQFAGTVVFDLFVEDRGQPWRLGSIVLVEVGLGDGRRPRRWVRLEPPEGWLFGVWNVHCPSTAPQAFEPLTLSGRFVMEVGPDGGIKGRFGLLAISGRLDPSGTARGTAGAGPEAAAWRGTIGKAKGTGRRGPLQGRGVLEFVRHPRGYGSGAWWSE